MAVVEIARRGMWNVFRVEHRMVQVAAEEKKGTEVEMKQMGDHELAK
jgi:hypothetical protein